MKIVIDCVPSGSVFILLPSFPNQHQPSLHQWNLLIQSALAVAPLPARLQLQRAFRLLNTFWWPPYLYCHRHKGCNGIFSLLLHSLWIIHCFYFLLFSIIYYIKNNNTCHRFKKEALVAVRVQVAKLHIHAKCCDQCKRLYVLNHELISTGP